MCLLSAVERDFDPIAQALGSFSMSSNMSVVTPEDAKEVFKLRKNAGKVNKMERAELLPSMQKMCEGLPILKVEEVTVSKTEYTNGNINRINSTSTNVRKKRFFTTCDTSDRCTDAPINGGRYCRWYTCNIRDIGGDCNLEHIRSGSWQCTVCCNQRREGNMCKCDEIKDEKSFVRCQRKNLN